MYLFLVLLTSYVHFFNNHSLVRIVLRILLVEIRSSTVLIVIVMYVIVQQRIVYRGEATARQHITTSIGRGNVIGPNKLEFVPPHNQRQSQGLLRPSLPRLVW